MPFFRIQELLDIAYRSYQITFDHVSVIDTFSKHPIHSDLSIIKYEE